MAKLEEYKDFKSKGKFFADCECINNTTKLREILGKLKSVKGKQYLFRGVSEAKYKLYTSGQREYIQNEYHLLGVKYPNFMQSLLYILADDADLKAYNTIANIQTNASYYFTYLQHYGAPTPYIDFTTDVFVALFFSCHNPHFVPSDNEIDNYLSLYYVEKGDIEYVVDKYNGVFGITRKDKGSYQQRAKNDDFPNLSFSTLQKLGAFYIDSERKRGDFGNKRFIFRMPNRNMLAQKGVLIYNADDSNPLEKTNLFRDKIHCLNIHKSLCDYIMGIYSEEGISYEKLFPNEHQIAQNVYSDFKRTLLK